MKLEAINLSCGYNGKSVTEHVDFTVRSGEICCLLGPNGAGKTTLFKTILRLLKPIDGRVLIDGTDIQTWNARKMAKHMAYVAQYHTPPFPYIVRDVIMLGRINSVGYFGKPSEKDNRIVDGVIGLLGIDDLADRAYTDISGGERQLVMIGRALAQEPGMLVLDEPTASLDYGNVVRVIKLIKRLQKHGFGIIMTTHSPDQAFMCNSNVVLLDKHKPPSFGSVTEIITEKNLNSVYGVDVRVFEYIARNGERRRICSPEIG